ncbi:Glycosyl transferase family 1 [Penicillium bovifimosum]|uniref:Glycosyl transferase family 1 n=1 Tax=Penicillium bovifimosum TaxID=126998 RepID=A0A9W9GV02_9EURO|nr:Glycosyl transferase family 1 [Penicillium bovifimosum]KAJ5130537.1 Glycosyl transferase family 1 [Penicillium bovifimosum]
MSEETHHKFERRCSTTQQRRLNLQFERNAWLGPPSDNIYAGVSVNFESPHSSTIAIAIRDVTYLLDFIEREFRGEQACPENVANFIIAELKSYSDNHLEKFIGISMPQYVADECPRLCPRLWAELDIVPLVMSNTSLVDRISVAQTNEGDDLEPEQWDIKTIDEQAESMARKGVRFAFWTGQHPLLQVGFLGLVEVDTAYHVRTADLQDFRDTVSDRTWSAVQHYANDLKERKVKVAFFSSTPQGGGVALMRHALLRFSHCLGTDFKWYVPKPRPGVFRVTKTNHNILQGIASKGERLTYDNKKILQEWIEENARRYWTRAGGPLLPPSEGGADVIMIDDPQMPGIIPIAKLLAPDRPIVFRSHIQIRSDLVAIPGSPQAEAWDFLWSTIKYADCFISHPVSSFVPHNVPPERVGYMPASTDWLDGLNKTMRDWDIAHYGRIFNAACRNADMPPIQYPEDKFIVQIARFDPSKGIMDVIVSYEKFYNKLMAKSPKTPPPKLLICGHGSVDDPDGAQVYDEIINYMDEKTEDIRHLICVMRLRPVDQVLNALLSKATISLQLSTFEGFEIKVSEAIHKGKPVIATRAGGIPLQVENGKNGFLVDVGDTDAVAQHLFELWTDEKLYHNMSNYAISHTSDEVSTVGNAIDWLYLAAKLSRGETVRPNGQWIDDMAFEDAGITPNSEDLRLTRAVKVEHMG